jgi:hypothetical protein
MEPYKGENEAKGTSVIRALLVERQLRTATNEMPMTAIMKSSGESKARMIGLAIGIKAASTTAPKIPPNIEETRELAKAQPAFPCWAMGKPSRIVDVVAVSPGIPKRMEVIAPP